ncbi:hypothetical protein T4E_239 [Trichinella pseudospiralis]|uniref:Uncharacterized protein n=1 Tax=Trichinella pseudospiralis TaxID=6337 RepID=A0A0V0XI37_TRIPS|nr:hypothetical protein T4E_239 [Trichinella pseudospiralis]
MKKRKQTDKPDQARPGQARPGVLAAICGLKFAATSPPSYHELLLPLLRTNISVHTQRTIYRPTPESRIFTSLVKPG